MVQGRIVEVPWRVAGDGRQRTIYARYELFGSRDLTVAVHVYEKWSCSPAGIVIGFRWDMNARLCGGEQDRRYECNIAWREKERVVITSTDECCAWRERGEQCWR